MENIKILISFLNEFCKYNINSCIDKTCPNYNKCDNKIWQDATTELILLGVLNKNEDVTEI